jgi:hypothetical protein
MSLSRRQASTLGVMLMNLLDLDRQIQASGFMEWSFVLL